MMKKQLLIMFSILMSMHATQTFAYDIAVENADGKIIYYNYINNGTELEVTRPESSLSKYSGVVVIPEEVTYMNRTRKVTVIGEHAFYLCRGLQSVEISNSVTDIKNMAFSGCSKLKSVIIPNSVTNIDFQAFADCSVLSSIVIGNNVTDIGEQAFENCSELSSVTIGEGITSIKYQTFYRCSKLNSITIPNSVTSIRNSAFMDCSSLTSLTIGNNVTDIEEKAFYGCHKLASITIGNSVKTIGSSAFYGCNKLTSVHITDIASWCKISFSDNASNPLSYAHHLFLYSVEVKDLVIPSSVTEIEHVAFIGCQGLTSVTIPNSVTSIGIGAFMDCSGLNSIVIPDSVTRISDMAFRNCSGLTSVTIGSGVTKIGYSSFGYCNNLTTINVEKGNMKYDSRDNCNSIIETETNTLVVGCKNTTIPNSVINIGVNPFDGCSSLTSITIPNSVTNIGAVAFWGCDLLDVISKIENPFAIGTSTFSDNTFFNATLFVPTGTIDKYKATEGWNKFMFIEEGEPSRISNIESEGLNKVKQYTLDGRIIYNSKKGINIIQMNNGKTKKVIVK